MQGNLAILPAALVYDPVTNPNGKRFLFVVAGNNVDNGCGRTGVVDRYVRPDYIQHDPFAPDGAEALKTLRNWRRGS